MILYPSFLSCSRCLAVTISGLVAQLVSTISSTSSCSSTSAESASPSLEALSRSLFNSSSATVVPSGLSDAIFPTYPMMLVMKDCNCGSISVVSDTSVIEETLTADNNERCLSRATAHLQKSCSAYSDEPKPTTANLRCDKNSFPTRKSNAYSSAMAQKVAAGSGGAPPSHVPRRIKTNEPGCMVESVSNCRCSSDKASRSPGSCFAILAAHARAVPVELP
mmetsp:Transcript_31641/g.69335  ORF Transcript_31641/g.69335 Transcript_31641/m.69335 type:complete len:221 (-) Transcript_31641:131-793(-)